MPSRGPGSSVNNPHGHVTAASGNDLPLVFPWRVVLLLVAAVPIVAALATTAFSGIALRLRPVRISTMDFD